MNGFILWVAQGFGVGRIPFAPGTFTRRIGVVLSAAAHWELLVLPRRDIGWTRVVGLALRKSRTHPQSNRSRLDRARRNHRDAAVLRRRRRRPVVQTGRTSDSTLAIHAHDLHPFPYHGHCQALANPSFPKAARRLGRNYRRCTSCTLYRCCKRNSAHLECGGLTPLSIPKGDACLYVLDGRNLKRRQAAALQIRSHRRRLLHRS